MQNLVVAGDDVQDIQQLSLVLVNPFDLNVEQRVRVKNDARFALDVVGQTGLVGVLGAGKGGAESFVVGQRPQFA